MFLISLGVLFRGFNASRFILYLCVLVFVVLFALRLDGYLAISYLLVFTPLFACNVIAFLGAFVGFVSFVYRPPPVSEHSLRLDFFAMLLTTVQHGLLACFEFLAAHKLDIIASASSEKQPVVVPPWVVIFAPLFIQCCLAICVSIWAVRHDKSFEFELFFSVNIIQFVFVAFKLDREVDWSWAVVFIPLWVVLSLSLVGVLYTVMLALLLARSRHLLPAHRRTHVYGALLHTLLVVPSLISLVLLTGKLDTPPRFSSHYAAVAATIMAAVKGNAPPEMATAPEISFCLVILPMAVSLSCLLLMSFASRGGNVWWFALRRPLCTFVLDTCPCLRQYANISYKVGMARDEEDDETPPPLLDDTIERPLRPVIPLTSIECPD